MRDLQAKASPSVRIVQEVSLRACDCIKTAVRSDLYALDH